MRLLPGPAEDVDSKDSRITGLFISRKKLCFWRQKEKWSNVVSCQGKSKFCEEQVQDQESSSNLVH